MPMGREPASLSLSLVPDDILVTVLEAHAQRCQLRAVARRLFQAVEEHFEIRRFQPPEGKAFCIDLEINRHMSKHLYCASFAGPDGHGVKVDGSVSGAVTFVNWVPAYYRSVVSSRRDVRHQLGDPDACALWRLVAKVRDQRSCGTEILNGACDDIGYLTVTEGCFNGGSADTGNSCSSKRQVIGRLSSRETELVLKVLDHRRNTAAVPIKA
mmetsp:Transcript_48753/g.139440  ORF Transcript_48753/g.139440 Transcript_48753/m.139440 type:complete len:212 (-) Transcript_48753:93-728(-)